MGLLSAETPTGIRNFVHGLDRYAGIQGPNDPLLQRMHALAAPGKGRSQGDPTAQYWLAKHYYWGRGGLDLNFTAAVHYSQMAAAQGFAEALQFMGILYAKGHGVSATPISP